MHLTNASVHCALLPCTFLIYAANIAEDQNIPVRYLKPQIQARWTGVVLTCPVLELVRVAQKAYFGINFDACQQDLRVGIDVSGKRDARVGTSLAFFQGRSSQHL